MWMLQAIPLYADLADFTVFTDKASYSGVLLQQGRVQTDADWNEQTAGAIHQGQTFGIFSYKFDGAALQPVVGSGIAVVWPLARRRRNLSRADQIRWLWNLAWHSMLWEGGRPAPFEGHVNADIFRLVVQCPHPPCIFTDSQTELDPHGGVLFLGVIAQPGFEFKQVTIEAVTPRDDSGEPAGIVPAWQVDAITFSAAPEPSTVALLAVGFCCLAASLPPLRTAHRS
jgi:hypothetical protein